ncbi:hypothetical protein [Ruegeria arenilitoris]|uniref:hypothetical protein n=1 Tax=Ruegeria arenilitoris TaxID=1173585 RepID=UPI0014817EF2|nr:hypothetical protein [Ruegeria arenilitoris]
MELAYETVRAKEFSGKPSRQDCVFCCESEADARRFAEIHGRATNLIYEVELVDQSALVHKTNYELIDFEAGPTKWDELARSYWSDGHTENIEVICGGAIRIVRFVGPVTP